MVKTTNIWFEQIEPVRLFDHTLDLCDEILAYAELLEKKTWRSLLSKEHCQLPSYERKPNSRCTFARELWKKCHQVQK